MRYWSVLVNDNPHNDIFFNVLARGEVNLSMMISKGETTPSFGNLLKSPGAASNFLADILSCFCQNRRMVFCVDLMINVTIIIFCVFM